MTIEEYYKRLEPITKADPIIDEISICDEILDSNIKSFTIFFRVKTPNKSIKTITLGTMNSLEDIKNAVKIYRERLVNKLKEIK
nr:MAG TPA: hypothetical protein [Bacteriophage sp.]